MTQFIDIYGITNHRTQELIDRFVAEFSDRALCEDRGSEELMMLQLDSDDQSPEKDKYDWEPAITLSHSISRGLDFPRRCFSIYLESRSSKLARSIIKFTKDDKVIFGLSLIDGSVRDEKILSAVDLLSDLIETYDCSRGLIAIEETPPDSESEFEWLAKQKYILYST